MVSHTTLKSTQGELYNLPELTYVGSRGNIVLCLALPILKQNNWFTSVPVVQCKAEERGLWTFSTEDGHD